MQNELVKNASIEEAELFEKVKQSKQNGQSKPKVLDSSRYFKGRIQEVSDTVGYFAPSTRASFLDENGEPEQWKFRAINIKENRALRKAFTKKVAIKDKYKRNTILEDEFDTDGYLDALLDASLIEPNFRDPALLDSWGVGSASEVVSKLLTPVEISNVHEFVMEISGLIELNDGTYSEITEEEKIKSAKN